VYSDVNFIFADSTTSRVHNAPGELIFNDIKTEFKPNIMNVLFCHHALTHSHGGGHDTLDNPYEVHKVLHHTHLKCTKNPPNSLR